MLAICRWPKAGPAYSRRLRSYPARVLARALPCRSLASHCAATVAKVCRPRLGSAQVPPCTCARISLRKARACASVGQHLLRNLPSVPRYRAS